MSKVPKYITNLLKRRQRLSNELANVNSKIDEYCEKIGVDMTDPDSCVATDIKIYCEVDAGYRLTLVAIEKALERKNKT